MKHSLRVTLFLLILFLVAQYVGIAVLMFYVDAEQTEQYGKVTFRDLPFGERPPLEEKTSYVPIIIAIIGGTVLALFLVRFHLEWMWRLWFFVAIVVALTVTFGSLLPPLIAGGVALALGLWKVYRPNFFVHTIGELLIYPGLAVIFVPLLNLISVSILLVLISTYDAYAVWKSKHMIELANSQTKAKVFAGFVVPYHIRSVISSGHTSPQNGRSKKNGHSKKIVQKVRSAILGGGDIGFPLIFAGVILQEFSFRLSLLIPLFAAAGLGLLLLFSKDKKFYPAMPFISAGCFLGLAVVLVLRWL